MLLNNLIASPAFSAWQAGESLDVGRLLYTLDGRPRLSIVSIAHLSEQERMFFVTLLLNEVVSWVRAQPGTNSLRALLYMDEVFGFFPPSAEPPSKRPMLTLLKQARAHGLGIVRATPVPGRPSGDCEPPLCERARQRGSLEKFRPDGRPLRR